MLALMLALTLMLAPDPGIQRASRLEFGDFLSKKNSR
jgi:hypothetical protein